MTRPILRFPIRQLNVRGDIPGFDRARAVRTRSVPCSRLCPTTNLPFPRPTPNRKQDNKVFSKQKYVHIETSRAPTSAQPAARVEAVELPRQYIAIHAGGGLAGEERQGRGARVCAASKCAVAPNPSRQLNAVWLIMEKWGRARETFFADLFGLFGRLQKSRLSSSATRRCASRVGSMFWSRGRDRRRRWCSVSW